MADEDDGHWQVAPIRMLTPEEAAAVRPGYVWPTPRALELLQREERNRWFDAGVEKGASHLLLLDRGLGEMEPLYVYPADEEEVAADRLLAIGDPDHMLYSRWRSRTVLEVYHLGMDKALQLEARAQQRPFNLYIPEGIARPTLAPGAFREGGAVNPQIPELQRLCKLFHYELVVDDHPDHRPDALGATGLPGSGEAQLCKERTIAVSPDSQCLVYNVSHELAHGMVGFCDEKDVLLEQATILTRWVNQLLKEIATHGTSSRDTAR